MRTVLRMGWAIPIAMGLLSCVGVHSGCKYYEKSDSSWRRRPGEDVTERVGRQRRVRFQGIAPLDPMRTISGHVDAPPTMVHHPEPARPLPEPAVLSLDTPTPPPALPMLVWVSRALPTGDVGTSSILVERGAPAAAQAGKSFEYLIRVTNLTAGSLDGVVVHESPAEGFVLEAMDPEPVTSDADVVWFLGRLQPGESRTIRVTGRADGPAEVRNRCEVSWETPVASTTSILQPILALVQLAPEEALLGHLYELRLHVANTGTGPATGVVVRETLPDGLVLEDGGREIRIEVGTLEAGTALDLTVRVRPEKAGRYDGWASAYAEGGLSADSGKTSTWIREPALSLETRGPAEAFVGRPLEYTITVVNSGDVAIEQTVVELVFPSCAKFVSVDSDGFREHDLVVWRLGTLEPSTAKDLKLVLRADQACVVRAEVNTRGAGLRPVTSALQTDVRGLSAVRLEVVDMADPVMVGEEVTYKIHVVNQGSAGASNIRVRCFLEDSMEYVSSFGATVGALKGNELAFQPVQSLGPKYESTWRVLVKAVSPGDVRFRVELTSDQLDRPVDESESSTFYE